MLWLARNSFWQLFWSNNYKDGWKSGLKSPGADNKNITANLTGLLTTFLVISGGFWGLRYRKKSYDENIPDPRTLRNKIYVEDLLDPEIKLIGIEINVFLVVIWLYIPVSWIFKLKLNKSKYFHVLFVISKKHKWIISNVILNLNIKWGVMILGLIAFGTNSTGVYVKIFKYFYVTLISNGCKNSMNVRVLCFGLNTIIFLLTWSFIGLDKQILPMDQPL